MQDFSGRIAVVTGGGSGIGRELVRQLAQAGARVAVGDIFEDSLAQTVEACVADGVAPDALSTHVVDVAEPDQLEHFRDEVATAHETEHVNLLFNNAGIGGGGSFVVDDRDVWERTFAVCWGGVYHGTRTFLSMLMAADEGHVVNTSSVNGFWASLGPQIPHTAYSAAKFAVKGFTEALVTDFRVNAPHLHASVVMPGHIGTSIVINSRRVHDRDEAASSASTGSEGPRRRPAALGFDVSDMSPEQIAEMERALAEGFRDGAPTTAAQAATLILDGVRAKRWRILVGADAAQLDRVVRADPEAAYDHTMVELIARDAGP